MLASETTHGGKVDKVARYGWSFKDKPGEFMYLRKQDLYVDESYQREANEGKIKRIVSEWSWIACNAICVGLRHDRFYVIDGQHRVLAAKRRSDITKLPCLVFDTDDNAEEAQGFLNANVNRKPMTVAQRFNALITSGDPIALKAQQYIAQAGRYPSENKSNGNSFTAIKALMTCIEQDEDALQRIWPLLIELCENRTFNNTLLQGCFYIENRALPGCSLSHNPWRSRLLGAGYDELIASINRARSFYAQGGSRVFARGILQTVNYRLKKNVLEIEWPNS